MNHAESQRTFNLAVAFEAAKDEQGKMLGRAVTESTFHHFADYNWDTDMGCPSFVEEAPSDGMKKEPRALEEIKTYVRNIALAPPICNAPLIWATWFSGARIVTAPKMAEFVSLFKRKERFLIRANELQEIFQAA